MAQERPATGTRATFPTVALPVVLDSDGGIDDAAALWWACVSPDVDVVAVTAVAGNVGVEQAAANLAAVLAAAGHGHVPVAVGADAPIGPTPMRRSGPAHGADGLGGAAPAPPASSIGSESARALLGRLVAERPGALTVVATGPLSNLALVLRDDPSWAAQVGDLVVMGGSVRAGGNAGPAAETNMAHDPAAAAEVVAAGWSRPPLLVGLDVTLQATLSRAELELVDRRLTPAAVFLASPLAFYRSTGSATCAPGECPCHDLVACMAAVDPALVSGPVLTLAVDTGQGAAWGATVVDLRELAEGREAGGTSAAGTAGLVGSRWRVGLEVDVGRFRAAVRKLFGE